MLTKQESNFDKLARLIKEEGDSIRVEMATNIKEMATNIKSMESRMATKDDIKSIESRMATKDDIKSIESRMATKADIAFFATKEDVHSIVTNAVTEAKEELLAEIRPLARAFDRDAVTTIDHDRRIRRIEKHLALE